MGAAAVVQVRAGGWDPLTCPGRLHVSFGSPVLGSGEDGIHWVWTWLWVATQAGTGRDPRSLPCPPGPHGATGRSRKTCRKEAACAGSQPPEAGLPAEPSLAVPLPGFEFAPLAGRCPQGEMGASRGKARPPSAGQVCCAPCHLHREASESKQERETQEHAAG